MQFRDIIGQDKLVGHLVDATDAGRVAHALLFTGQDPSSLLPMALAYASYLNCLNPLEGDSCGRCSSCRKTGQLLHPDLHFLFPTAATKKVKKDPDSQQFIHDFRKYVIEKGYYPDLFGFFLSLGIENKQGSIFTKDASAIQQKLSLKPYEGKYKIVVIWYAEKMNPTAANKLLKFLEEPPSHTVFLLTSESSELLLPTILSRVQLARLAPLSHSLISNQLVRQFGLDGDRAGRIASLSSGNWGLARQLAADPDDKMDYSQWFQSWMRLCYGAKIPSLETFVQEISGLGRERQKQFLKYSLQSLQQLLLIKHKVPNLVSATESESSFQTKFEPFLPAQALPAIYELLNQSVYQIERNAHPKLLFMNLSLQLIRIFRST